MKHLSTAAILAMLSTAAWATVSEPPEPPQERPETNGGNRDVPHGCLTTWSTAEQRFIPCDEAKPTTGPKSKIIFEGEVTR